MFFWGKCTRLTTDNVFLQNTMHRSTFLIGPIVLLIQRVYCMYHQSYTSNRACCMKYVFEGIDQRLVF